MSSMSPIIELTYKANTKLLTREQELILTKKVQKMKRLLEKIDPYTREEQEIIREGKKAKEALILANTRLVVSIAKKFTYFNNDIEENFQNGILGLEIAIDKFNPELGYKLSTYAYRWIKQSINRMAENTEKSIRLPIHIHSNWKKIKRVNAELRKEGKTTNSTLIDKHCGWEIGTTEEISRILQVPISLNHKIKEDENEPLDMIASVSDDDDSLDSLEIKELILQAIAPLTPQERIIIIKYFGLDGQESMSLRCIAGIMKLSTESVRQIKLRALNKLKINPKLQGLLN